ncbi:glycosyltransferase family 4 protein [Algibacter sp. 2305UL17-15]|uniref:glycosyltransferase family 4 protein n=1 Tax=Algibacter sp. 2305UL17-15 TaxID=3231268 RepID=UPI003458C2FA
MKIAFLTPEYPHPEIGHSGGIGTSIKHLAEALVIQGHDVVLLVYGQKRDHQFKDDGIQFYAIKNVKLKGLSWYLTKKKIEKLINTLHSKKIIDIVEAPDWTGISSFINPTCPIVIRQNGSDTYFCHLEERKVKFINFFFEKKALKDCDGIISVSAFTGQLTNKLFQLKRQFTVIPNGINTEIFKSEIQHNENENPIMLYFGTLIRKKGLLELPHIFNQVNSKKPNARLVLIGKDASDIKTGNNSTWSLMKPLFSEEAFKNVDYKGSVPYEAMKNHIETADVCVFPTFAEALPVSWLEAMAMQKAIVASNVGWGPEVIDDGVNGFLVNPNDHNSFADKIDGLLNNKALRRQFGVAAKIKIETTFDRKIIAEKSVEFYESIL